MTAPALARPCSRAAVRSEWAAARRRHRRRKALGLPSTDLVDAQPVRDHIAQLRAAGMGWKRVAAQAGVPTGTVSNILYGGNGYPPSPRTHKDIAARLLAVRVDTADMAVVPGIGARRRLQALVACGWTCRSLADALGHDSRNFTKLINGRHEIRGATDRAIRRLYDQLWDVAPPEDTPEQRRAVSKARNLARSRGWPVPMAWDDDDLDDPAAMPAISRQELADHRARVVANLTAAGRPLDAIAAHVGMHPRSVRRLQRRAS